MSNVRRLQPRQIWAIFTGRSILPTEARAHLYWSRQAALSEAEDIQRRKGYEHLSVRVLRLSDEAKRPRTYLPDASNRVGI